MVERLKQIWGGFEQTTTRKLFGRGVDNIVMPQRAAERAPQVAPAPEKAGVTAPAEAAFAALRGQLEASHKRFGRKPKKGLIDDEPTSGFGADSDYADAPEAARDLIKGLAATEARISRDFKLYDAAMMNAGPKKKKLFGLF